MLQKAARRGEGFLKRFLGLEPSSKQETLERELFLSRGALLEGLDNEDMGLLAAPMKLICDEFGRASQAVAENSMARYESIGELPRLGHNPNEGSELVTSTGLEIIPYCPPPASLISIVAGNLDKSDALVSININSNGADFVGVSDSVGSQAVFGSPAIDVLKDDSKSLTNQVVTPSLQACPSMVAPTTLKDTATIVSDDSEDAPSQIHDSTLGKILNLHVPSEVTSSLQLNQVTALPKTKANSPASETKQQCQVTPGNRQITEEVKINIIQNIAKDKYKFTQEEVAEAEEEWKATLIGVMVGGRVPFRDLLHFMEANWKVKQPMLYYKDNGIIIFKFSSFEDIRWVLENGPWVVWGNRNLILKEWHSGMALSWSSFTSVPVWVKVLDINPIFLSSRRMLDVIGNMIGRPISMDRITSEVEKLSYARFLVEVTPEDLKREEVVLESYNGTIYRHLVEFEWTPKSCDICNRFGHHTHMCRLNGNHREEVKVPAGANHWLPKSFKAAVVNEQEVPTPLVQTPKPIISNFGNDKDQAANKVYNKRWKSRNPFHKTVMQQEKANSSGGLLPTPSPMENNDANFPPVAPVLNNRDKHRYSRHEKGKDKVEEGWTFYRPKRKTVQSLAQEVNALSEAFNGYENTSKF